MGRLIDLTGMNFSRLTVLRRSENNTNQGKPKWVCECECGNITEVGGYELKSGNTKSCGCLDRESARERMFVHGMKHSKLYYIWSNMKDRCYREGNRRYSRYGQRGIKVCDEWLNDFTSFHDWSMMKGYKDGLSIERIDNDGNYEPENCKWIPMGEQAKNKGTYTKKTPK